MAYSVQRLAAGWAVETRWWHFLPSPHPSRQVLEQAEPRCNTYRSAFPGLRDRGVVLSTHLHRWCSKTEWHHTSTHCAFIAPYAETFTLTSLPHRCDYFPTADFVWHKLNFEMWNTGTSHSIWAPQSERRRESPKFTSVYLRARINRAIVRGTSSRALVRTLREIARLHMYAALPFLVLY
jgi:hypothetical protein